MFSFSTEGLTGVDGSQSSGPSREVKGESMFGV